MTELTQNEISVLKEEIDFVLNNIGIDQLEALESNCMDLYQQTEGIIMCTNACRKINEMNKMIRNLQNDTVTVCKKVAYLAENFQSSSNN